MTKIVENAYNKYSKNDKSKEKTDMLHKFRYILKRDRCYCETQISKEQLEKMIEKGAILVDVRSPQEFAEGHLKNAILLPMIFCQINYKLLLFIVVQVIEVKKHKKN